MKIPSIPHLYRHMKRWREILTILSKYGLSGWLSRLNIRIGRRLLKNREGLVLAELARESRIRMAIEELGPTFIKLGQILSTRPDIVGIELAEELKLLQAAAPADSFESVRETLFEELGPELTTSFVEIDPEPLASASIGQVHRARLSDGSEVVVKVQHRDIIARMSVDLEMMGTLATLAERIPEFTGFRPTDTVAEFRRLLRRELDFTREELQLREFARNFEGNDEVRIPRSYPRLSSRRVLTMERLRGITIAEAIAQLPCRLDLDEIAQRGARAYFEMIFIHGFYHADPHPGNVLLLDNDVIGLLDFGMVGRLPESLREDVAEMLVSIVEGDSDVLTSIILRVCTSPTRLDEQSLSNDVGVFVAHYSAQPIESFDLSSALKEMIEIIRRYRLTLPAPLALLLKVLIMLEGTARLLSPKFSLMEVVEPYRQRLIMRRFSPSRQFRKIRRFLLDGEDLAFSFPRRIADILQQIQSGKYDVHLDHRGLEPSVNRLVLGMLSSALFLGSSIMVSRDVGPKIWDMPVIGTVGLAFAVLLGIRLWRAISKSGHLDRKR